MCAVGSVSFVLARGRRRDERRVRATRPRASMRHRFVHSFIHSSFIIHCAHASIQPRRRSRPRGLACTRFAIRREEGRVDVAATEIKSRFREGRATWGWKESFQPAIFRDQSRLHIDGYNPMRKDDSTSDHRRGFRTDRVCACAFSRLWVRWAIDMTVCMYV